MLHCLLALRIACVLTASIGLAGTASATVISGASDAFDISIEITSPLAVDVNPLAQVSGSAPAPYTLNDTEANISAPAVDPLVTATQSEVNASSDVDGLGGVRSAAADSQVDDADLDLGVLIPGVLDLTADVLLTSSTSSGDFGALASTAFADIQELNINVLGNAINPTGTPAPNTVLFDSLGLTIIVNEQIFGGDGANSTTLEVNAIHILLDDVGGVAPGLGISGDIVIAHSYSELLAVPEPGTGLLLGLGLVGLTAVGRPRR